MGAWGPAVFEHDAALDWIDELEQGQLSQFVTRTLRLAAANRATMLEADVCAAALAAAETVAAGLGRPCRGLPDAVKEWLETKYRFPNATQIDLACKAIHRIGSESELAELWKGDRGWNAGIRRLQDRLTDTSKHQRASAAQRPKPKAAKATERATEDSVSLAEVRKIVRARKGGLAMVERRPYFLGLSGVALKDLVAVVSLAECQSLEHLDISGNGITDRVMEYVGKLPNLEQLELDAPKVTDDGLKHLTSLNKLQDLKIDRAEISDDGLSQLSKLESLTSLRLRYVRITDKGLRHLAKMNQLNRLHIVGAFVTANALSRLGRRLKCHVYSDCLK